MTDGATPVGETGAVAAGTATVTGTDPPATSADAPGLIGLGSAARPPIALGTGSGGSHGTSIAPASRPAGEQPGLPHRFADTAARAAKSLAIVLVLLLAAVGFVLIQDRLDKKDPRLALAPLQSDVARFD